MISFPKIPSCKLNEDVFQCWALQMDILKSDSILVNPFDHVHKSARRMRRAYRNVPAIRADLDLFGICPWRQFPIWNRLFAADSDLRMPASPRLDLHRSAESYDLSAIDDGHPVAKFFRFFY